MAILRYGEGNTYVSINYSDMQGGKDTQLMTIKLTMPAIAAKANKDIFNLDTGGHIKDIIAFKCIDKNDIIKDLTGCKFSINADKKIITLTVGDAVIADQDVIILTLVLTA